MLPGAAHDHEFMEGRRQRQLAVAARVGHSDDSRRRAPAPARLALPLHADVAGCATAPPRPAADLFPLRRRSGLLARQRRDARRPRSAGGAGVRARPAPAPGLSAERRACPGLVRLLDRPVLARWRHRDGARCARAPAAVRARRGAAADHRHAARPLADRRTVTRAALLPTAARQRRVDLNRRAVRRRRPASRRRSGSAPGAALRSPRQRQRVAPQRQPHRYLAAALHAAPRDPACG